MLHVTYRVARDRTLTRLSREHPDCRLLAWCNLNADLVEVRGAPAATSRLVEVLERDHGARVLGPSAERGRSVLFPCKQLPGQSLRRLVEEHDGLLFPPVVVERGWETHRVALFEPNRLAAYFADLERRLGPYEILRKSALQGPFLPDEFLLSTAELLGNLTLKQAAALAAAIEEGYYRVPRAATMVEIAGRRGTPRTTMEEHLRKGEAKVISAIAPFLPLHTQPRAPGRPPSKRRSPGARRRRPGATRDGTS